MAVNKVEFGGDTLLDLTRDTVTPQSLLSGYSAHNKAGELIDGLAVIPEKLSELEDDVGYAKTESPTLTGEPKAPTPLSTDNSTRIATTSYVKTLISNLINGAPETLDTLKEIADALGENDDAVQALNSAIGNKVDKVSGKGLSTNDYTMADKNKLANLPDNLEDVFVKKSGDTMTGELLVEKNSGTAGFRAKRTDTDTEMVVGVGVNGYEHGIYSNSLGKWIVYADKSTGEVRLNGAANNSDTVDGKNKSDLYIKKAGVFPDTELDTFISRPPGSYIVSSSGASNLLNVLSSQYGSASALELYNDYNLNYLKVRTTIDNNRYSGWKNILFKETADTTYAAKTSVDELKKSVSDGKKLVADAITAKGVATAADSTFAAMSENIGKIQTGSGVLLWENTANGTYKFVHDGDRWIANNRGINSSTATSTWKVTVPAATTAYIGWRTATESSDKLTITLNGTTVLSATGGLKSSETSITLNLATGENTLTTTYTKDSSVHSCGDMAYVILPPIGQQPGAYKYQSKSVIPGTSAQTVTPDTGYDGLYSVSVGAAPTSTSNGKYFASFATNATGKDNAAMTVLSYNNGKNQVVNNQPCSTFNTSNVIISDMFSFDYNKTNSLKYTITLKKKCVCISNNSSFNGITYSAGQTISWGYATSIKLAIMAV